MQHSMRALLGVILVGWSCGDTLAAESGPKWWHFGQGREADVTLPPETARGAEAMAPASANQQPSMPQYSSTEVPERRWMLNSPLAKVSWPRVHMPELPKPQLPPSPWPKKSEIDAARNSWVESNPDPLKPSPMQAMSNGARRVGQSTRAAWDKTVDVFTPGNQAELSGSSSRVARRDRPPVWERMFGSNDLQKKEGSQTIPEFMAQDRLGP